MMKVVELEDDEKVPHPWWHALFTSFKENHRETILCYPRIIYDFDIFVCTKCKVKYKVWNEKGRSE